MGSLDTFVIERSATLDRVLALVRNHLQDIKSPLVTDIRDITLDTDMAMKETWSLVEKSICHLKDGAPGHQPGSMAEALSKISLRSSTLATSLGVKPPLFEQLLFQADYTDGHEAALFLCRRLIDAAEGDVSKSRQIIAQKILMERPELSPVFARASKEDIIAFKKQMGLSLDLLLGTYTGACKEIRSGIATF